MVFNGGLGCFGVDKREVGTFRFISVIMSNAVRFGLFRHIRVSPVDP